jgi:hypothetical protein
MHYLMDTLFRRYLTDLRAYFWYSLPAFIVMFAVSQWSVLGPPLFNIFNNNLHDVINQSGFRISAPSKCINCKNVVNISKVCGYFVFY